MLRTHLYPPHWKRSIVPAVLERAAHHCEKCGVPDYAQLYSVRLFPRRKRAWYATLEEAVRVLTWLDAAPLLLANRRIFAVAVRLSVTHLDHDEQNPTPPLDRLMAKCQLCHLRYDAPDNLRRRRTGTGQKNRPRKLNAARIMRLRYQTALPLFKPEDFLIDFSKNLLKNPTTP